MQLSKEYETKIETLKKANIDIDKGLMETINEYYEAYEYQRKVDKIDKTTGKYKVGLLFVNKILVNLNKDPIDDLTKFQKIDRTLIIKDENYEVLEEMEPELFEHFDKRKCGYDRKETSETYILSILRGMCKQLGFIFQAKRSSKTVKRVVQQTVVYSIVLKK